MKKMSIAEQTLLKQIRNLIVEEKRLNDEAHSLITQAQTVANIRRALEDEQHRLERQREAASISRKPSP